MFPITIPDREIFDEGTEEFLTIKGRTLVLEHSLVSISKWESKYKKPFLSTEERTNEEMLYYIKCMTLTQNVDDSVFYSLTNSMIKKITNYIETPMTATTFTERKRKGRSEIITSELIYYWMITYNIPSEYQKWHLSRLLTLIKICQIKNEPQKKMSRHEILSRNAALNAQRRAAMNSTG